MLGVPPQNYVLQKMIRSIHFICRCFYYCGWLLAKSYSLNTQCSQRNMTKRWKHWLQSDKGANRKDGDLQKKIKCLTHQRIKTSLVADFAVADRTISTILVYQRKPQRHWHFISLPQLQTQQGKFFSTDASIKHFSSRWTVVWTFPHSWSVCCGAADALTNTMHVFHCIYMWNYFVSQLTML